MKKFSFPLDRVLKFRQTQARLEALKLAQLQAQLDGLHGKQKQLWQDLESSRREISSSANTNGVELASLERYRLATTVRSANLDRERSACRTKIRQQAEAATARRQEAKLLERLRERRLSAWQADLQKEVQAEAEEAFLSRWSSRGRNAQSS